MRQTRGRLWELNPTRRGMCGLNAVEMGREDWFRNKDARIDAEKAWLSARVRGEMRSTAASRDTPVAIAVRRGVFRVNSGPDHVDAPHDGGGRT